MLARETLLGWPDLTEEPDKLLSINDDALSSERHGVSNHEANLPTPQLQAGPSLVKNISAECVAVGYGGVFLECPVECQLCP